MNILKSLTKKDIRPLLKQLEDPLLKSEPIISNSATMLDIMATTLKLAVHFTNEAMRTGGWRHLYYGSKSNEHMDELVKNPALALYTQFLVIVISGLLYEQKSASSNHYRHNKANLG